MGNSQSKTLLDKPLVPAIIMFAIPVVLSSWLQLFFSAADLMVVGKFAADGAKAQAAIGSTASLINLIIGLFNGFALGVNVLVAHAFGANDKRRMIDSVRTAMFLSLVSGLVVMAIGLTLSEPMLKLMGTNENVLESASNYLKIYFIGAPFMMIYNFGSAVLRSTGDTKSPMIYLTIGGIANVFLNLFAVIVLGMGVLGVALATAVSNLISAALVVYKLLRTDGPHRLVLKDFSVNREAIRQILRIGLPAGLNSISFSLSNVIIQSAYNSFNDSLLIAGNNNAMNIENFIHMSNNAIFQAIVTFTSQSIGANKPKLIKKILSRCLLLVIFASLFLGVLAILFGNPLASMYSSDPDVIQFSVDRMNIMCLFIFVGGIMECLSGSLRGMGNSLQPTIVTLTCVCGFRIVWVYTIFQKFHTPSNLYISYPITWILAIIGLLFLFFKTYKKIANSSQKTAENI